MTTCSPKSQINIFQWILIHFKDPQKNQQGFLLFYLAYVCNVIFQHCPANKSVAYKSKLFRIELTRKWRHTSGIVKMAQVAIPLLFMLCQTLSWWTLGLQVFSVGVLRGTGSYFGCHWKNTVSQHHLFTLSCKCAAWKCHRGSWSQLKLGDGGCLGPALYTCLVTWYTAKCRLIRICSLLCLSHQTLKRFNFHCS